MRISLLTLPIILLFFINPLWAIKKDSVNTKSFWYQGIVPAGLIGGGLLLTHSAAEKNIQQSLREGMAKDFENSLDDYLPFVPVAQLYLADIAGVKSKNHWFHQSKYLFISNVISSGLTHGLKHLTQKSRPDGSALSFPSGHTSLAFTNATVLYQEFRETNSVLAYSGYAFSTTTGVLRMMNNRHWISDVLVGAGMGILATNLVYYWEPLKDFNPFKNTEGIVWAPQIKNGTYGMYVSYQF